MARRYLLGFDVGSSSVKASLTDVDNGEIVASAFYPDHEAPIMAVKAGWAEQDPQMWWDNAKLALKKIMVELGALVFFSHGRPAVTEHRFADAVAVLVCADDAPAVLTPGHRLQVADASP